MLFAANATLQAPPKGFALLVGLGNRLRPSVSSASPRLELRFSILYGRQRDNSLTFEKVGSFDTVLDESVVVAASLKEL